MTTVKIVGMPGPQGPQGPQGPAGPGGGGDIADFVFAGPGEEINDSSMTISDHDMVIQTTRLDSETDADISIESADDVWINANGDEVGISAAGIVEVSTDNGSHTWTFSDNGRLDLPGGGNIENPPNSSGDGLGLPTLRLTPATYLETDQYIILDPTAPNHIHIRAGGNIDESSAQLILGGETNHVTVNDSGREVVIKTGDPLIYHAYVNINYASSSTFITNMPVDIEPGDKVYVGDANYTVDSVVLNSPFEGQVEVLVPGATFLYDYIYTFTRESGSGNYWIFTSGGNIYGPDEGGILTSGVNNLDGDMYVRANNKVIIDGQNGVFLNDPEVPDNQVATLGDLNVGGLAGSTTGSPANNTSLGISSFSSNTEGYQNTAVGVQTLYNNTTGNNNTVLGVAALFSNISGGQNVAVGVESLRSHTTGVGNSALGSGALYNLTSGNNNTALGVEAGFALQSGSNNTLIGNLATASSTTVSNQITLGNSSINSLRCQVTSITGLSDARDKKNIETLGVGLGFINKLNPVKFDWNMRDGGKVDVPDTGFIAQELIEVEDESGMADYLQLTYRDNPEKLEASYGRLVPILVKAIQELSKEIEDLKANR